MICVCVSVCSFDLSVIFDACARLKRGKHAHHVVYIIICVVLFDFTSVHVFFVNALWGTSTSFTKRHVFRLFHMKWIPATL